MFEAWESIELMGAAYYKQEGAQVSIPLVKTCGYDFIADLGGRLLRVNVKTATPADRGRYYISGNPKTAGSIDVYLIFIREFQRFIELPASFSGGQKIKHIPKRIIDALRQEGARWNQNTLHQKS